MKCFKPLFLLVLFACSLIGQAQELPFEKYGFSPKVVTLSNGKYQEFHDLETVVEIGSVLYNTETNEIVGLAEQKESNLEEIKPFLVNRWISPDPLSESYASLSPYNYVGNNPIKNIDPNGMWIESFLDVGFILYDVGEIAYDYITTGEVNPVSVAALGADVACLALPVATGGGLAVRAGKEGAEQVVKHTAKEVVTEGAEKAIKQGGQESAEKGARFVSDTDGKLIDTKTTPKGSYKQPDGTRTDVLQEKSHYDKNTKQNHGTSHTHDTYKNVDADGNVRTGVDSKKTHTPTYEEVKNIENGVATQK